MSLIAKVRQFSKARLPLILGVYIISADGISRRMRMIRGKQS